MTDDVPEINVSPEPCGHPKRPHVVDAPGDRRCTECGAELTRVTAEPAPEEPTP